jgi:uncharacterized protein YqjF (DUF2071 family)
MDTLIRLSLRDLLFINYSIDPERLRPFVPDQLQLDTLIDTAGRPISLLSVVAFRVTDVRTGALPLPGISFDQISYRAYVKPEESAAYFFETRINSRAVTSMTSLLRMPVSYEQIEIVIEPVLPSIGTSEVELSHENPSPGSLRYSVVSFGPDGIEASVRIGGHHSSAGPTELAVPPDYITERPVGYVTVAGGSLYKITADHEPLDALVAHVESVRVPILSSVGIMNLDETSHPHSVLYVREAQFETRVPRPVPEH